MNVGDTPSKFVIYAKLILNDIIDPITSKPIEVKPNRSPDIQILKPGVWNNKHAKSFVLDNIEAVHNWEKATLVISGYFYNQKNKEKQLKCKNRIKKRVFNNPHYPHLLSKEDKDKVQQYKDQQKKVKKI